MLRFATGHAVTLAHEGGHAIMAVLLGGKVTSLTMSPRLVGPLVFALVYSGAALWILYQAAMILVGAKDPLL